MPLLVVLTGPSGAGKDSVIVRLKSLRRSYHFGVTATTRAPRQGEHEGVDYKFVTPERFEAMLTGGELLEHAEVYGHQYGVPKGPIRDALKNGRDVILRTDVQGARYIKSVAPETVTIFVATPTLRELKRRLKARGVDSPKQMELRLRLAEEEMAGAGEFDHVVINDDLDRCVREVEELLAVERDRREPLGLPL